MSKISAYAKLLRFPGLGGLAIPTVIGAISVSSNLNLIHFVILFIIGCLASIYGFVLNDYFDIQIDKVSTDLSKRPLVSGEISPLSALVICYLCLIFAFLLIFILFYGEKIEGYRFSAVICIVLAGLFGSLYNIIGKKIAGSDFIIALSVSFLFLFGALSVGMPTLFTWIIFLLTFNNLLHMNAIEGGVKDSDHDYKLGVKNIASVFGVKVEGKKIFIPNKFKIFGIGIRLFSSFLLLVPFIFFSIDYMFWQIFLLISAIIGVLFFSFKLISINIFDRNKIRKYIAVQSFLRYSLVPLMLISTIGILYSFILIIFPIFWYFLFISLIGETPFKPNM